MTLTARCIICKEPFKKKAINQKMCSRKCVNKRSNLDREDYFKEYARINKNKIKEYRKNYRRRNKIKIIKYILENRDKYIEAKRKYRQKNKDKTSKYSRRYREQHREDTNFKIKAIARQTARNKIKTKYANCENCGIYTKIEKHHSDYSKPLRVIFLCVACHHKRHRKWDYA